MIRYSYIVELTDSEGYKYERYNGSSVVEAKKIYNEFKERNHVTVELYQRITMLENIVE